MNKKINYKSIKADQRRNALRRTMKKRQMQSTFENFEKKHQETAYEKAKQFVRELDRETSKGLFMYGLAGSGKTHLAAAIANETVERCSTMFISVPELLFARKKGFDDKGNSDPLDVFTEPFVLVIDDIGSENKTEWVKETLFMLIDRRYADMKPTIITSNNDLDSLKERLGYRTASRIAEMCDIIKMKSRDHRIQR